jgi:glycosyltransferase involved in cell wall biosynthesis
MSSVSVIIPARNERYLEATLESLYQHAGAEIEVVVILDGPTQYPVQPRPNLIIHQHPEPLGIRACINQGVHLAGGSMLLKLDAHVSVGDDFVSNLAADCKDNQVMVARRWTLDLATWEKQPRAVDYYYLSCPWTDPRGMMQSCPWITRTEERILNHEGTKNTKEFKGEKKEEGEEKEIDDLMCFQGSMWMMTRAWWRMLSGISSAGQYVEHHEISMKTWALGGSVVINKGAWYAHPKAGSRGYEMDMERVLREHAESARFWTAQPVFPWLVEKFWPLPTAASRHRTEKFYWPENWRDYLDRAL